MNDGVISYTGNMIPEKVNYEGAGFPIEIRATKSTSKLVAGTFAGSRWMEEQRVVVLYGASLFVVGVETCLKDQPGLEVVRIGITLSDTEKRLRSLRPDVIIFDSSDVRLATWPGITQFLRENPGILVIGLDLTTTNEVTIFSSHQYPVTKVEDLIEAIMGTGRG